MNVRDHRPIPDGSQPLPERWLRVLRLLRDTLNLTRASSCYSDEIAPDTDGRTVAPVLVASACPEAAEALVRANLPGAGREEAAA